jgi:hypothetical protein
MPYAVYLGHTHSLLGGLHWDSVVRGGLGRVCIVCDVGRVTIDAGLIKLQEKSWSGCVCSIPGLLQVA